MPEKWWKAVRRLSRHYQEFYGYNMENDTDDLSFARIHPDDIDDYKKAMEEELIETHHLEYVFRVWNQRLDRYVWTKMDAISKPQTDGTSLVYADTGEYYLYEVDDVFYQQYKYDSEHDSLTGLYNTFFGEEAGDQLLCSMANTLKRMLKELQEFAMCSKTKKDSFCSLTWMADDGVVRKYHGYVHYNGYIGNYTDLMVTFMNVTEINRLGVE